MKRLFDLFRTPSAEVLAQRELDQAERDLLAAHSARGYAAKMAEYHAERITRLRAYLREVHSAEPIGWEGVPSGGTD